MTIITLWIEGKETHFENVDAVVVNNGTAIWEAYNKQTEEYLK